MKKSILFFLFITLIIQSCNLMEHPVHLERTSENNTIITKETKIKSNGRTCFRKEITTHMDSLNKQITFKEVVKYNCNGAYSYEVKRKKWKLENGKKIVTRSKK